MENFILIALLLVLGMLLRYLRVFTDSAAQVLNQYVIYLSLPALVLINIPQLQFGKEMSVFALVPWMMVIVSAGLVIFIAKISNWDRPTTGALLLLVPLGNTSFVGIPIIKAFFGEDAVSYALMYDLLGSFPSLAVYGSVILAIYGDNQATFSIKAVAKKILAFPPFISLVIGILLQFAELPRIYFDSLTPLANTLVPVVMLAVGIQLRLKPQLEKIQPFIYGLSIKMIMAPALLLFVFKILGTEGRLYDVMIFESAMPPMVSAGALAIMANLSPRLTAAMVAYGIILSFVTMPLLFWLIN